MTTGERKSLMVDLEVAITALHVATANLATKESAVDAATVAVRAAQATFDKLYAALQKDLSDIRAVK